MVAGAPGVGQQGLRESRGSLMGSRIRTTEKVLRIFLTAVVLGDFRVVLESTP